MTKPPAIGSGPSFGFSRRATAAVDQPISFLMAQAVANPQLISLAAGLVDYDTLPAEEVAGLLEHILRHKASARAALQYGTTEGLAELRKLLFAHMAQLDAVSPEQFPGAPDRVVVSTGSQQLLHILTDLLVDPGDIVITAWPTYFVYTGALMGMQATIRTVDMDERGMVPERVDALLSELKREGQLRRVKIVYVCSYHQNPTGLTLAEERRAALLEVVKKYSTHHRILLLEDAAYRELNYAPPGGVPGVPGSIKRHDRDNRYVALLQTFSKPFAPGLKTGYGLLPDDLYEPALLSKGGRDFGSTNLCQHLLLEAMRSGVYLRHVRRLCQAYARKREAMLQALEQHMGDLRSAGVSWTRPSGGLYVWLTLPESVDTGRAGPLFSHAVKQGVLFVPGEYCFPADPTRQAPHNQIRLSFGVPTVEQIDRGVARLAGAIRAVLEKADAVQSRIFNTEGPENTEKT